MIQHIGNIPVLITDETLADEPRFLTPEEQQAFANYFELLRLFGKIKYTVDQRSDDEYIHTFTFNL